MNPIDTQLIEALRNAAQVVVLTGAGVSAESGIATFRDKQSGLWESFDATQLATRQAFERDPALVWGWYEWRRLAVDRAQPNPAHWTIAAMARKIPRMILVTQNVDDLHERAGHHDVLHLHGRIAHPYCERCLGAYELPRQSPSMADGGERIEPPRCNSCSGRVRPGVVWFGESLPMTEWALAVAAAKRCGVLLSVGTSSQVQPAASLIETAARAGAATVQINPNVTGMDDRVRFDLKGVAGSVLPELYAQTWGTA